jgi:hypothetical protein
MKKKWNPDQKMKVFKINGISGFGGLGKFGNRLKVRL